MAGVRRSSPLEPLASLRTLPVTLHLLKPPFRALPGIARELGRELDDGGFDRPVQQTQLVKPPEAALKIAALNQPLNRIDRAVLTAHPNKDGRIVSPLLGQFDTVVDEGFQVGTGGPFGSHPGSIPQRTARRDPKGVGFQAETLPSTRNVSACGLEFFAPNKMLTAVHI